MSIDAPPNGLGGSIIERVAATQRRVRELPIRTNGNNRSDVDSFRREGDN